MILCPALLKFGSALKMSVIQCAQLGSTLSVRQFCRAGLRASVVDFVNVGSSLSLRNMSRVGSALSVAWCCQLGSGGRRGMFCGSILPRLFFARNCWKSQSNRRRIWARKCQYLGCAKIRFLLLLLAVPSDLLNRPSGDNPHFGQNGCKKKHT